MTGKLLVIVECFLLLLVINTIAHCQDATVDKMLIEADRHYQIRDMTKALNLYEDVLIKDKNRFKALQMAGYIRSKRMDFKIAEKHFTHAIEVHGESSYLLMMTGNALLQQFRPVEAKDYYLKAKELSPDDKVIQDNILLAEENILRAKEAATLHERATIVCWFAAGIGVIVIALFIIFELFRSV